MFRNLSLIGTKKYKPAEGLLQPTALQYHLLAHVQPSELGCDQCRNVHLQSEPWGQNICKLEKFSYHLKDKRKVKHINLLMEAEEKDE